MAVANRTVDISGGTRGLNGYVAQPEGDGPFPGLVIIHEIMGLNDDIRGIADRFAEQGYVALAVDLYAGRSRAICVARFMSYMLFNNLNNNSINDLKAALNYLETLPQVDGSRVGAVGFCLGGYFAICWACSDPRLQAVAPFYALNPRPLKAVERACPVVGSYPEPDFSTGAGRKLDAALDEYNIAHDIKIYPGATHSFFNGRRDSKPENQDAAEDTWARVLTFFDEHIG